MEGELTTLVGPEGEDWRVPVSELESRQNELASRLADQGLDAALIQTPVDLYYYSGGRQNASLLVTADGDSRLFVRRSLSRAKHESGGDDSPHTVESFPRMAAFAEEIGCIPSMQFGELPHSFANRFASRREERLFAIALVEPFTIENGLLTQTLKQKREKIIQRDLRLINKIYGL